MAGIPSGWSKSSGSFKIGEWQPNRSELVTNGGFDSATWWTVDAGCSISDGTCNWVASATGKAVYRNDTNFLTAGKRYRIKFEVKEISEGGFYVTGFTGSTTIDYSTTFSTIGLKTIEVSVYTNSNIGFRSIGASTTGKIDNVSITEIPPLPTFKPGTKYLECVTAGTIALPSKQAYGTWEFDWYKGADANDTRFNFISNKSKATSGDFNGYRLNPWTNEAIYLSKEPTPTGLLNTAASYIANNTWYRIKITRSTSGVFTLFIKGGAFTPTTGYDGWTLVSVAGGSGTNPVTDNTYTTSEYFVLDIDAGDRIANIQLTDGIKRNEQYGAELVDQSAWYTAGYWTSIGTSWSQVGTVLSSDGSEAAGWLIKNGFWTVGKKYKIVITSTRTSGTLNMPFDGGYQYGDITSSSTFTYYYTPAYVNMDMRGILFVGTITALSIKEVTQE